MKKITTVIILTAVLFVADLKAQWAQMFVGVGAYNSVFFVNKDTGFVAGDFGDIRKTTNGGVTWSSVHSSGATISEIEFPTVDTGYAVTALGNMVYKSIDSGATWTSLPLPAGYYSGTNFIDGSTGYICGQNTGSLACILKTVDGGSTWTSSTFVGNTEFSDIEMVTPNIGYAAGFNFSTMIGCVYKTTNAGASWAPTTTVSIYPDNLVIRDLSFVDTLTGYLSGDYVDDTTFAQSGIVFKTTDGGTTWSRIDIPTSAFLKDIQMVTDSIGFIAGTKLGSTGAGTSKVYKTVDAGATWLYEYIGPAIYGIGSLHFTDPMHGYCFERGGSLGGFLKYDGNVDCFAHYSVDYDSITNVFTVLIDSASVYQAAGYHWDFGDGTTSNLATPTHVIHTDTAYNVCMTVYAISGDSCQYCHILGKDQFSNIIRAEGYTINVWDGSSTAGINATAMKPEEILVYPNPANGIFNIKGQFNDGTAKVYDATGRLILQKTITGNSFQIDLSAERNGIYMLELLNTERVSRIKLGKK